MRVLLALAMLAFPATATAAPYGALPSQRVAGGTACTAPTGAPGELSRWTRRGVELLVATPDGLRATGAVAFGALTGCPRVAADPGGAAIAAAATEHGLRVAVRAAGGAFGAPVTLSRSDFVFDLEVGVSARGDAVVAWAEFDPAGDRGRVRVARRDAGAAFGAPVDIVPWRDASGAFAVRAGMAADGEAVVAAIEPSTDPERQFSRLSAWSGRPGAPLGPPQRLPSEASPRVRLAVAPDGRAVLAESGLRIHERAAGGAFGAPQRVESAVRAEKIAIGFGAEGRAVIAWQDEDNGGVAATVRGAAGFGPPVAVVPEPPEDEYQLISTVGGGTGPDALPNLQAAIGPDDRAVVAWPDEAGGAGLATLVGGAVAERQLLGGALRYADGLSLLALADGRGGLAWLEDRGRFEGGPADARVALEGVAPPPEATPPRVTVGVPRRTALRPAQSLVVPVRCSAACDVRVSLPGPRGAFPAAASLDSAGTVNVEVAPLGAPIAPPRAEPVRLAVRASAPGARTVTRTTRTVRLRRLAAPPLPRVTDLRARRLSGGRVEVRWRTTGEPQDAAFLVSATTTRDEHEDGRPAYEGIGAEARRTHRLVLEHAAGKRWVHVRIVQLVGEQGRTVRMRLR
jgi:hypothetical protein